MEHNPIAQALSEALAWMFESDDSPVHRLVTDPDDLPDDAMIIVLDGCVLAWT